MFVKFRGRDIPVTFVPKGGDAEAAIQSLDQEAVLGIDIETYATEPHPKGGLEPHVSAIRLIQLYDGKQAVVLEMSMLLFGAMRKLLRERRFVAHNALFEIAFLTHNFDVRPDIGCSQIMYSLLVYATNDDMDEKIKLGLAHACAATFKMDLSKVEQKSDWSKPDLSNEQIEYAALDAIATRELAYFLASQLEQLGLYDIYKLTKRTQYPIVEMQLNGIYFDTPKHDVLMEQWEAIKQENKDACEKIFGEGVENINSGKQLHEWLVSTYPVSKVRSWKKSEKTGLINFDKENLANHEHFIFVPPLRAYKKYAKMLSTYGQELRDFIVPSTNRIHCSFKLSNTTTGRMSCNSPNLQNQPKGSGMRGLYIPEPGSVFTVADYNQMELRVLAYITKDPVMLAVYAAGEDLHLKTAGTLAALAGVDLSSADPDTVKMFRNKAKAINFGIVFGIGKNKLPQYAKQSYGVDMSPDEAKEVIKAFFRTFPGVAEWHKVHTKMCGHYLTAKTLTGRIRKLHKKFYFTTGLNLPVQGTSAEVTSLACCLLHERRPVPYKLVLVVHDEIILEHLPEYSGQVREHLVQCMEEAYLTILPGASSNKLVDANTGDSWEEAK